MRTNTLEKPLQEWNDDVLIQDTLDGNKEAFGILVRKYTGSLYDLAHRILGSGEEAEDALQDAFTEAYRHLAGFNHKARFSTWLYSIVLNRVRNRLRHNRTIRWSSLDASSPYDPDSPPMEMREQGPSLQTIAEDHLTLEAVEKGVQTLPFEYRCIFILHYMQDWPLREIAEHLGRPVATVKVYLHRARKILYRQLAGHEIAL